MSRRSIIDGSSDYRTGRKAFRRNRWVYNRQMGETIAKQFIIKTDEIFKLLKYYPAMGKIENGDIRGFQLSPHTKLLYRVRKNYCPCFFYVRQDPNKKFS